MNVRDFMITKVYTVKPTNTVKELLELLTNNRIGGVPVVDDKDNLVGMISDGDVLRYLAPNPIGIVGLVYIIEQAKFEDVLLEKLETPVKEIMTKKHIVSVSPDDDFEWCIKVLSHHRYKKLPVINGAGRVIGVLSRGDMIRILTKKMISS